MNSALGIHHITLITGNVQANVDFYAGFLGLRLVKRTAGYEDAAQLHLFYGDAIASAGSLVTFLVWEAGGHGRAGYGQTFDISFAINRSSIGFWLTRALRYGFKSEGPMEELGEPVIRLKDPDGIIVKLVGTDSFADATPFITDDIPEEDAIKRIYGTTILSDVQEETEAFLNTYFGYDFSAVEGTSRRMISRAGDIVDVRDATGFWSSAPGTGTVDHIAFRAKDEGELNATLSQLEKRNSSETNAHDRKYFQSFYVREPGGVLIEMATDAPGMSVDEPLDKLGEAVFIPPVFMRNEDDIRVALPQFSMPGEERVIYRELPFVHRFYTPENPDGSTLILLHGSGGNEASLMPLAHSANPRATLLGIRGRSTEEGVARWFRRLDNGKFDQRDILSEIEAFEAFIEGAFTAYSLDKTKLKFIGQSNGANFISAFNVMKPHLAHDTLLLRPINILDEWPVADLTGKNIQIVAGSTDTYFPQSEILRLKLEGTGANISFKTLNTGHDLIEEDIMVAKSLLK